MFKHLKQIKFKNKNNILIKINKLTIKTIIKITLAFLVLKAKAQKFFKK